MNNLAVSLRKKITIIIKKKLNIARVEIILFSEFFSVYKKIIIISFFGIYYIY